MTGVAHDRFDAGQRTKRSARTDRRIAAPGVDRPSAPVVGPDAEHPTTAEVLDQRVVEVLSTVTHETVITGETAERLWDMYAANIGPLDEVAALRHLDPKEHVLACFANPAITKIVGWVGDEPIGLGMITNQLDLVVEISPAFFRTRYPEHAERNAIYYGMVIVVAQTKRGLTMFSRLYTEMWDIPARADGVIAFDICQFNRDMFDADSLSQGIADLFPHSKFSVVDQQTFYVAELPEPLS